MLPLTHQSYMCSAPFLPTSVVLIFPLKSAIKKITFWFWFVQNVFFLFVKKINHILFKLSAKLLITAVVLCVLFGNGTHLHTVFNHLSDHVDFHAFVHAHHVDTNHNSAEEFDKKDTHQHPTVSIDLEGTLTQKTVHKAYTEENFFTVAGEFPGVHSTKEVNEIFLDLPPPDLLILSDHYYSLSLRGPPTG